MTRSIGHRIDDWLSSRYDEHAQMQRHSPLTLPSFLIHPLHHLILSFSSLSFTFSPFLFLSPFLSLPSSLFLSLSFPLFSLFFIGSPFTSLFICLSLCVSVSVS